MIKVGFFEWLGIRFVRWLDISIVMCFGIRVVVSLGIRVVGLGSSVNISLPLLSDTFLPSPSPDRYHHFHHTTCTPPLSPPNFRSTLPRLSIAFALRARPHQQDLPPTL